MKARLSGAVLLVAILFTLTMATGCARQQPPQPPPAPPAANPPPGAPGAPGTTPGGPTTPPAGGTGGTTTPPTGGTGGTTTPPTGGTGGTTTPPTGTPPTGGTGGTTTPPTTGGTEPTTPPPAFGRTDFELAMDDAMLAQLNQRRAAKGLGALRIHNALVKTAAEHSADEMNRNYFSSTNPEGQTLDVRGRANGFPTLVYSVVGKNTENPQTNPNTPAGMAGFMLDVYERQATNAAKLYNAQYNRVGIGSRYRNVPAYPAGKTTYNTLCFGTITP